MGLLYNIEKPKSAIKFEKTDDYQIIISENISENEYLELELKINEAEKYILEEVTKFGRETFIENSENKSKMNFRVGRVFRRNELIGYAIGYCELHQLDCFLIDVIFIIDEYKRNGIGFQLTCDIINSIIKVETINTIKLITQKDNLNAIKLIERIQNNIDYSK